MMQKPPACGEQRMGRKRGYALTGAHTFAHGVHTNRGLAPVLERCKTLLRHARSRGLRKNRRAHAHAHADVSTRDVQHVF